MFRNQNVLKSKSMENNVNITGLQESQNRKEPEKLAEIIRKMLEIEMAQEAADTCKSSRYFVWVSSIETRNIQDQYAFKTATKSTRI